jgi:hypothetical protein
VGIFSFGGFWDQYAMRFVLDSAITPGASEGWRLKGCAAVIVAGSDQPSFGQTENRKSAAVSPCGSSQLRMTLPSDRDVTRGEKLPVAAGDAISRRFVLVADSARFAWQPEVKQLTKINANTFETTFEFIRMISSMDCRGSTPVGWGSPWGCHGNALPSVVKSVANLDKDFAGIQIVRSAKGEAVTQQNATVRDVDTLNAFVRVAETNLRTYVRGGWSGGVLKPASEGTASARQIVPVAPGATSFIT